MTIYLAAFDETENDAGDFLIGGWIGPERDSKNCFEPAWDERVLAGSPRIAHLHTREIWSADWQEKYGSAELKHSGALRRRQP